MADRKKRLVKRLKVPAIVLGIALLLFFLLDSVIMPRYVQQGKTTKVPHVVGKKLDDAVQVLAENGLVGKKAEVRTDKQYPEGTVVLQNPPADAEVKSGRIDAKTGTLTFRGISCQMYQQGREVLRVTADAGQAAQQAGDVRVSLSGK
jgi:hypothetical protein